MFWVKNEKNQFWYLYFQIRFSYVSLILSMFLYFFGRLRPIECWRTLICNGILEYGSLTEKRLNSPLIRPNCARSRFWSDPIAFEVASDQTQLRSKLRLIRPNCVRSSLWSDPIAFEVASDQTQLRSNSPLIRPKCARRGYDQTQLRSKLPLIRPKCARIRLWSDFPDHNDLWSDHLQTMIRP